MDNTTTETAATPNNQQQHHTVSEVTHPQPVTISTAPYVVVSILVVVMLPLKSHILNRISPLSNGEYGFAYMGPS